MAAQVCSLLSEECRVAINHIVSYELHVSDAYLSMACYYDGETKEPPFATFFEDQAEVKRAHARQFLKYLRKHESKICLPVIQRPDIDNWGTGLQALESALELENTLNKLLQDLKTLASENHETDLTGNDAASQGLHFENHSPRLSLQNSHASWESFWINKRETYAIWKTRLAIRRN
uniref:Ferritin n=1 Tax=Equus caballus TaxID=9796 RepID=A0A9L0TEV7_HORSE